MNPAVSLSSSSQLSQRRLVHGRSLSSPRLPPFGVNKAELYTDLQSRQCDTVLDADFGGQTLTSGVYCISAAGTISQVTLNLWCAMLMLQIFPLTNQPC